jgi:His-Xaa-Ser system protein HxsD
MPQAATEVAANEITVEFDASIQSLDALQAAAYRLIGAATCRIDRGDGRFLCRLAPAASLPKTKTHDPEALRSRFHDLVTDENVRERLAVKTEPVRNLILSLAFGSLAFPPDDKR